MDKGPSTALLQCPICNIPYDATAHEPKLLTCHHSFCLSCLLQLADGRQVVKCPEAGCRKKTKIPDKGVDGLQKNFYVLQVKDLVMPTVTSEKGEDVKVSTENTCDKHINQPLLFFCETCMVPICMNCTVLDHEKNSGHKITDVASAVKVHYTVLEAKKTKIAAACGNLNAVMKILKREVSNLEISKETSVKHLESTFTNLKTHLDKRQEDLVKLVGGHYTDKKELLIGEAQSVKKKMEILCQYKDDITKAINSDSVSDSVKAANNLELMRQIDEGCSYPEKIPVAEQSYIVYEYEHGLQEFLMSVKSLGYISCERALPTRTSVSIPNFTACLPETIIVKVGSLNGTPLSGYPIRAKITNISTNQESADIKTTSKEKGEYVIKYTPRLSGTYSLQLLFQDQPMWGTDTEFIVHSNDPVLKIGAEGVEPGNMKKPTSVAVAPNGSIYVADMGNKRVQIFNNIGKLLGQFKIGSGDASTLDICVNSITEEVLCTKVGTDEMGNMLSNTVKIFTLTGERKHQFTNGEMRRALFLCTNSKGQVICTDMAMHCFYIYSKEGMLLKKIGQEGQKAGELCFPSSVCIGKDDSIIISDTGNNRIQIFTKSGKHLHKFNGKGDSFEVLKSPRGVAADGQHILVADSHNRIMVFTYEGTIVSCIESTGDPINIPYNLALTQDGYVLVADYGNHCVKKFRYK